MIPVVLRAVDATGDLVVRRLPGTCLLLSNGKSRVLKMRECKLMSLCRLLFCVTTFMAATHCLGTRNERTAKHDPAMEVHV